MSTFKQCFTRMGARVKVGVVPTHRLDRRRWKGVQVRVENPPVRIDVRRDEAGEYFDVQRRYNVQVIVSDVVPKDRHLLLLVDEPGVERERQERFLCGFDERAWFAAAVPEDSAALTVQQAKDSLKPREVWESIRTHDVPMEHRDLRCTAGFMRQGEWFFLPRPWMEVDESEVLHDEPVQRAGGKPHVCEWMYRTDGEAVLVCEAYPNGLSEDEFSKLDRTVRERHAWREARRDAIVHVSGYVRHPDHETIVLPYWHRVVPNTETRARSMQNLAFLD